MQTTLKSCCKGGALEETSSLSGTWQGIAHLFHSQHLELHLTPYSLDSWPNEDEGARHHIGSLWCGWHELYELHPHPCHLELQCWVLGSCSLACYHHERYFPSIEDPKCWKFCSHFSNEFKLASFLASKSLMAYRASPPSPAARRSRLAR